MPQIAVEVDPALRFLLWRQLRGERVEVEADRSDTVGHVVQRIGVPLTEVGDLTLDGHPIPRGERRTTPLPGPAALRIRPRRRPQPDPVRFLLDVHLGSLARRMRLLGLDVAYSSTADDPALAERAAVEDRMLLTRDRGLLFRAAVPDGAFVRGDRTDDQLDDVLDRFSPALAPWTRCLACGHPLRDVPADEVAPRLEPGTVRTYREFSRCTGCGRVYWRGAHSPRLEAIVEHARERVAGSGSSDS
jgi:uncharacterized protein with PIN domain